VVFFYISGAYRDLHSFPTRRSSDLTEGWFTPQDAIVGGAEFIGEKYISVGQDTLYKMRWNPANPATHQYATDAGWAVKQTGNIRSEEHTSELQSRFDLVCRLLLEKK